MIKLIKRLLGMGLADPQPGEQWLICIGPYLASKVQVLSVDHNAYPNFPYLVIDVGSNEYIYCNQIVFVGSPLSPLKATPQPVVGETWLVTLVPGITKQVVVVALSRYVDVPYYVVTITGDPTNNRWGVSQLNFIMKIS